MSTTVDPRHTVAWQRIRKRVISAARVRGDPCGICHKPIDYTLSGRSKWGATADHRFSIATHPGLALDPSLLRVVHRFCNLQRGGQLGRARQLARRSGGVNANPPATRRTKGMVSREW